MISSSILFFQERFSLHLYSINGKHLFTEKLDNGLGHMIIKDISGISGMLKIERLERQII
jgi:hypothetical protein